jgi:hypothetical protein
MKLRNSLFEKSAEIKNMQVERGSKHFYPEVKETSL